MSDFSFQFEKFMKDLEIREEIQANKKKQLSEQESAWPVRELDKRYREHTHNRLIVRRKNEHKPQ